MRTVRAWKNNFVLLLALSMVNSCLLQAQSGTSSALSGDVTDPSGAAVPNATVTATDVNTKATRTGETDADGHFLFSQINPGTYQVVVEARGFAPSKSEPTAVGVGRTVALNFSLRVQSNSQTVEVTAAAGPAQSRQSQYHYHHRSENDQEPPEPRPGPDLSCPVCTGCADEHSRLIERRQGCGWLWQRRVQWASRNIEWLHSRWLRYERSLARTEHRAFNQSRHRPRCGPGSDREHQLLLRRSGTLCRGPGELLHQVRHQRISWGCRTRYGTGRCSTRRTTSSTPTTRQTTSQESPGLP